MISTIQMRENIKQELTRFREKENESYEEIIVRMMNYIEKQKKEQKTLLIQECEEMAGDSLRITKEWESTDKTLDWQW